MQDAFYDPDTDTLDLLAGVQDPEDVQFEVAPADVLDKETGAAIRVLQMVDDAYAAGKPKTRIPCPICGKPLRYRKDDQGRIAECPSGDFVCID